MHDIAKLYLQGVALGYPDIVGGMPNTKSVVGFICEQTGSARTTVQDQLSRLERSGALTRTRVARSEFGQARAQSAFEIERSKEYLERMDVADVLARRRAEYKRRKARRDQESLHRVKVKLSGPIALAMLGDPHLDDPDTDVSAIERDVEIIRNTEGMLAIAVGDYRNNWVGKLAKLHADQSATTAETLALVEWFFSQVDWLVLQKGNHDEWNCEGGDPGGYILRLIESQAIYQGGSTRLDIRLPKAKFTAHVRHDFPGNSQFNAAHGHVRQTLFGHRDHVLVCGDRHQAGYIPIWHNDPEPRLCHGFRIGAYKGYDDYAAEKGFKKENWTPAMCAVVDPDLADEPERFIKPFFNLEDAADYLKFLRARRGE